jgi:hypothetical protein
LCVVCDSVQGASDSSATLGPASALTLSDVRFNLRLDVNAQVRWSARAHRCDAQACAEERPQGRAGMVVSEHTPAWMGDCDKLVESDRFA